MPPPTPATLPPHLSPYAHACQLIRAVGSLLRVPTTLTVTALLLLHRSLEAAIDEMDVTSHHAQRELRDVATACLFLAAKTEEFAMKVTMRGWWCVQGEVARGSSVIVVQPTIRHPDHVSSRNLYPPYFRSYA